MKRVLITVFVTIFLGLFGCEAYADNVDRLIIYTEGPLDTRPPAGYEIEFFPDGMIQRIRQFQLSDMVDLYRWDSSGELITYVSEYITEREGNRIIQFQVGLSGEKQAVSTFEIRDNGEISFYQHKTNIDDTIIYRGNLSVVLQDESGGVLQRIEYEANEITLLSPTINYREISQISQSELTGFRIVRGDVNQNAEINFDGINKYTIIVPDLNGEVPFAEKVTLLVPQITNFSQDAVVLNNFLTVLTAGGESTYLLPFVSRGLVP